MNTGRPHTKAQRTQSTQRYLKPYLLCALRAFVPSCVILFIFVPSLSYADIFDYPLTAQTMNAFNSTCARLSRHPVIKGSFEQVKRLERLDRSLNSSGNFIIASNIGMVWETLRPFPSTMVLGKDFIIQFRPGGQKTVLSAQGNETFIRMADVLNAVFSGNAGALRENFEIFYAENASGWELGLIPMDRAIASFAVTIIMTGDSALRTIVIREQNGDSTSYNLSDHIYSEVLSPGERSLFTVP